MDSAADMLQHERLTGNEIRRDPVRNALGIRGKNGDEHLGPQRRDRKSWWLDRQGHERKVERVLQDPIDTIPRGHIRDQQFDPRIIAAQFAQDRGQ
jgi:hypothetical protein